MGQVIYDEGLRERAHVFVDRVDAAEALARLMAPDFRDARDAVVLAIPAGGIPVGLVLAERLGLPFDLLFVRKLHFPDNPETGFGAVSEHGEVVLNPRLAAYLDEDTIAEIIEAERRALAERIAVLRGERAAEDLSGKTAIIVDDGLASGFTMLVAIREARARGARRVVVAVPTASAQAVDLLAPEVDTLYVANIRGGPYFAVAEAYTAWRDISLDEAAALLRSWRMGA